MPLARFMSSLTLEDVLGRDGLEVVIDDYGFTGEGYVELEDGWLSVPRAMPGERVRVEVEEEATGGRRVFARVTDVLEPADERRDPLCEKFDVCRGCHVRHLSVPEELAFKRRTVREVIARYADLPEDEQPEVETVTPRPTRRGDAYRIRSRLAYRVTGESTYETGLHTPHRPELVAMDECPALTGSARRLVVYVTETLDAVDELPPAANGDVRDPDAGIEHISVGTPTFGRGLVAVRFDGFDAPEDFEAAIADGRAAEFLDDLAGRLPEDVGLAAHGADTRITITPPERITLPLHDLRIQAGYDDWFPATLEPTEAVQRALIDDMLELDAAGRYLDIGCGVGTLSLLVGERVDSVTGIDINRHSIEAAELNAVRNDVHNVEFIPSGWERALRELVLDDRQFDVATINPMREPLGERPLAYLHQLEPRQAVYLGPSPESAAKDIGELRSRGWRVEGLAAGNVHPATYHTMLVADLRHG